MRALSGARCTVVRLYTLRIKIGTNQLALGEHSHCRTRLRFYFAKADEFFWREGQGSERMDLKNNGFFIAHLSLKCSN